MKKISNKEFNSVILSDNKSLNFKFKPSYTEFSLNGRKIYTIDKLSAHYRVNKRINSLYLSNIPTNNCAVGFKKGYSYLDFFTPHLDGKYFLKLDIKNFFHSIPENEISSAIKNIFPRTKNEEIISPDKIALEALTVKKEINGKSKIILPIGFPTSPAISNIIFRRIDILIQKECEIRKIKYTRYADDMLFSSPSASCHHENFLEKISYLVSLMDLKLNQRKTIKSVSKISINGFIIDNSKKEDGFLLFPEKTKGEFRISSKKLKPYKKIIQMIKSRKSLRFILKRAYKIDVNNIHTNYNDREKFLDKYAKDQVLNKLSGSRSHLISILKYDRKNECLPKKNKKDIEKIIEEIELILSKYL